MRPNPEGTTISGSLGLHYFVEGGILIWFGWVMIISGLILMIALLSLFINGSMFREGAWTRILIPTGIIIFLIGLLMVGRFWSGNDARYLKKFLMDILEAKEVEARASG